MARILGFHPRGPGSIPGVGEHFFQTYLFTLKISNFITENLSCLVLTLFTGFQIFHSPNYVLDIQKNQIFVKNNTVNDFFTTR